MKSKFIFFKKIVKVLFALAIVSAIIFYLVSRDYKDFLPKKTKQEIVHQDQEKTISIPEVIAVPSEELEILPEEILTSETQKLELCLPAFNTLNSIIIKFFLHESCDEEISILKNMNLPKNINNILSDTIVLCKVEETNVVQNKVIDKIITIRKTSDSRSRQEKFLVNIAKLQEYFYSKDFVCR